MAIFDTFGKIVISCVIGLFSFDFLHSTNLLIVKLSIYTNWAIIRLVFPIFLAFRTSTKKSAIFEIFALVPLLLFCEKMAIFHTFGKIVFSRLLGLFSCGFLA